MATVEFTFEGLFVFEHDRSNVLKVTVAKGARHTALIEITQHNTQTDAKIITHIKDFQIQLGVDISVTPTSPPSSIHNSPSPDVKNYNLIVNIAQAHPNCKVNPRALGFGGIISISAGETHTTTPSEKVSYVFRRNNPADTIWLDKRALKIGQSFDLLDHQSVVIKVGPNPTTPIILDNLPDTEYAISITNTCNGTIANDFMDFYDVIAQADGSPIPWGERYNLFAVLVEPMSIESIVIEKIGEDEHNTGSELFPCIMISTGT